MTVILRALGKSFDTTLWAFGMVALFMIGISYTLDASRLGFFLSTMRPMLLLGAALSFVLTFPLSLKIAKYELDSERRETHEAGK